MENKKKSKSKILIMLFAIVLLVVGASFAIWHYSYSGTEENVLSSPDLSLRFLESNNEVISIDNGVPMKDEDGIKQSGTGNVFDFEVKSKALMDTDVSYDINLEKLSIDSGKTALSDSDIKVYVEDFNGNTVLKPTKVSDLSNYKLFTKVHRHSKSNNEISTKYKLKVWIDENVDVFSLEGKQYKFRVGVSTNQKEQDKNQTYSLVYNLDGGTGSITDSTFKVGDKVTISSTVPVKAGYKFLGWSTKKSASSASYKAGEEVTLNDAYDGKVTLYAVWQGKTYTVKYDSNGGTGSMDDSVFKLATDVKLSNNKFSKENYTFIGWSTSKGGEVTYTNEAKVKDLGGEGDIVTLYAVWKSNTYTIKYDSNGGNGFVGESSYNYGNSIKLTKNKFTKDGYTFIGWNTNKDANAALYTDEQEVSGLSGNITLYAVWRSNTYTIKYDSNGGNGSMSNVSHGYGESKRLAKNTFTKEGYTFVGWNTDKNASVALYTDEQEVSNIGESGETVTLYAVWKANTYTVKYDSNGGNGSMANVSYSYGENKKLTKNTFTKSGYTFIGWNTNKDANAALYADEQEVDNLTKENNELIILYAIWEKDVNYTIRYNANGGYLMESKSLVLTSEDNHWELNDGVYRSGNYHVSGSTSSIKSDEFTLTESSDISFEWAVSSESASFDYLYYTIYKDGTALSETGTSTKIGGYNTSDTESNLSYRTITKNLEAGSYVIEFTYKKDGSGNYGLDRGYVKNIKVSNFDAIVPNSAISASNKKLAKNIYERANYDFLVGIRIRIQLLLIIRMKLLFII